MTEKEWNDKQKKLFKLYFSKKNTKRNGTNIKNVISSIEPWHLKWDKFQEILKKYSTEFRSFSIIEDSRLINYKHKNYLIIKIMSLTYLCIDLEDEKIITFGENLDPFNQNFFIDNFNEKEIDNPEQYYFSIDFESSGINELMNFILENKVLFYTETYFKYLLRDNDEYITYLNFDIQNGNITLYFGDEYSYHNSNYIYIDNDLNPIKIEEKSSKDYLKKICSKIKLIKIPFNIIPAFLIPNITSKNNANIIDIKKLIKINTN